ncbi:MAG: T9SS type A sorting domain-containing protein [Fibrobacteres bacterium]|nr:T9SS type A sorting domain-containing protein [Fibrobacterota bacterium]
MRLFLASLILLSNAFPEPCQSYNCDSVAVRAILDSNKFTNVRVSDVSTKNASNRIDSLKLTPGLPSSKIPSKITTIPNDIGKLSSLIWLSLSGNNISTIPDSFANLSNLSWLSLSGNKISSLPNSFTKLSNLKTLSFSGNPFSVFPTIICSLSNLRELALCCIGIPNISAKISNLTNLYDLDLSYNNITSLPQTIGGLSSLGSFSLTGNQLTLLPSSIGNLHNLYSLYLDNNHITSIPDSLCSISGLSILDVSSNSLCRVTSNVYQWLNSRDLDWKSSQGCVPTIIDVANENQLNTSKSLYLNIHPNPFNSLSTISYEISHNQPGTLQIYSSNGQLIITKHVSGNGILTWNALNYPGGIYICKLILKNKSIITKAIFTK